MKKLLGISAIVGVLGLALLESGCSLRGGPSLPAPPLAKGKPADMPAEPAEPSKPAIQEAAKAAKTVPPGPVDTAAAEKKRGPETQREAKGADSAKEETRPSQIAWQKSLDEALKSAQTQKKPVLVDFFATWCGPCRAMEKEVWPNPQVVAAAASYVPVKLDIDQHRKEAEKYNIEAVPTIVILDSQGKEKERSVGFREAEALAALLKKHAASP